LIEKIGIIKNPLTIIAMFAAIAEISGTLVLPFITEGNQSLYVWFLIVFPLTLIVLFFLTLNFNYKVLYSPSDYKDEKNFVNSLPQGSGSEKLSKIEKEIVESDREVEPPMEVISKNENKEDIVSDSETTGPINTDTTVTATNKNNSIIPSQLNDIVRRVKNANNEKRREYLELENLAVDRVATEFSGDLQRDVKLAGNVLVDGVVGSPDGVKIIEVKIFKDKDFDINQLVESLFQIHYAASSFFANRSIQHSIVLVIVFENFFSKNKIYEIDQSIRSKMGIAMETRYFSKKNLLENSSTGAAYL
jgi:hypothetical protein